MNTLHKLQEEMMKAKEKFTLHQTRIKTWFDKKPAGNAKFDVGDLVLKWDKPHEDKGKHTKSSPCGLVCILFRRSLAHTRTI